jgi:hypothetical protein
MSTLTFASHQIRSLTPSDMPAVAALIDATGLFPSGLLPAMVAPYFKAGAGDDHWGHAGP